MEKTNSYEVKVKSEDGTHLLVYLAKEERAKALKLDDQLVLIPKYVNPTAPHLQTDSVFCRQIYFRTHINPTCSIRVRLLLVMCQSEIGRLFLLILLPNHLGHFVLCNKRCTAIMSVLD